MDETILNESILDDTRYEIEKSVSNIIGKVKLMIENIKSIETTSHHSMFIVVSIIMVSHEHEKKFIQKYEYYLNLFNTLLSFFRVEELNLYNKDLFDVFVELLYETIGRKIFSREINICYQALSFDFYRTCFMSKYMNILSYSSQEEHKDYFDLIEKEFHMYMNDLYGMIFRNSLSNEESKMIHLDYLLRNEYFIYSLDYIFYEELYEFMVIQYDEPPINDDDNDDDDDNINNIIYQDHEYDDDEEEYDIYS
jgi:hypothetical protein